MKCFSVTIEASDEFLARQSGAHQLDADPDQVIAHRLGPHQYLVTLKEAPDQFWIVVSKDRMEVLLRVLSSPVGKESQIELSAVQDGARQLKITAEIDPAAVNRAVCRHSRSLEETIIAQGSPPVDGEDAKIIPLVGPDSEAGDMPGVFVVKPGQKIARVEPATPGRDGKDVFGKTLPAADGDNDYPEPGEGVLFDPEQLTYTASTYGIARIELERINIESLVRIDPEEHWAEIRIYPVMADGSTLTCDEVVAALSDAGVSHGIYTEVIEDALRSGEVQDVRAAVYTPPIDGIEGHLETFFRLNQIDPLVVDFQRKLGEVEPSAVVKELFSGGDLLARKVSMKPPVDGMGVSGRVLPGAEAGDIQVTAGKNVWFRKEDQAFVVADGVIGYADYVDGVLSVESPVSVSNDLQKVLLSVHPATDDGKTLKTEQVRTLVEREGFQVPIDWDEVEQILAQARVSTDPIIGRVIGTGSHPQAGTDGWIELKVSPEASIGTKIEGTDRIDYRERNSIRNVSAGDLLAVIIPPGKGVDGIDVYGRTIPASDGAEAVLKAGENVSVSDDGKSFTAMINGSLAIQGGDTISVCKHYEVSGDVDMDTGNLFMDGSLTIGGWIRSGFRIKASSDILVRGGIEDASAEADGNLTVNGGVVGSGDQEICIQGDLSVRFLEGARVRARGNVFVHDSILRSDVSSGGRIVVGGGRGYIRGGSVEALNRIKASVLGSATGIRTLVTVGTQPEVKRRMQEADKHLSILARKRARIELQLARSASRGENENPDTRRELESLARMRQEVVAEERKLAKRRKDLAEDLHKNAEEPVVIEVRHRVYAGTTVVISGYPLQVKEDLRGRLIFKLNRERQTVEINRSF